MVSMFSSSFKWPGFCFVCLFVPLSLPCHSGLQPNLLSFPQQQSTLLLPQTGPGLTSWAVGSPGLSASSLEPHLDAPQHLPGPKHLPGPGGNDEPTDLEELEKFAKTFKQRRIKLGFTQVCSGIRSWKNWVV